MLLLETLALGEGEGEKRDCYTYNDGDDKL